MMMKTRIKEKAVIVMNEEDLTEAIQYYLKHSDINPIIKEKLERQQGLAIITLQDPGEDGIEIGEDSTILYEFTVEEQKVIYEG